MLGIQKEIKTSGRWAEEAAFPKAEGTVLEAGGRWVDHHPEGFSGIKELRTEDT